MSNILTREAILEAEDIARELVEVPEWGGAVWVYGMTGAERDRLEKTMLQTKGNEAHVNLDNARARVATICIRDENGKKLFMESDIRDLSKKSAKCLDKIFDVAAKLSGITKEDVDELTKNSESDQSDGSTSD